MQEFDKSISFDGRDIRLKVGLLAPQGRRFGIGRIWRYSSFGRGNESQG